MQEPVELDLTVYQGASWDRTITWKIDGTAVNLTGYTARMQVRRTVDADATLIALTSGSGITITAGTGTIALAMTAAQTAALPPGTWVYDLEVVSGGGEVTRLMMGALIVDPEVTR